MQELVVDGGHWRTADDVYDAFFGAVGAPEWHGRNLDALADSISTGSINTVEVPYRLVIRNYGCIAGEARTVANRLVNLIREVGAAGCPVEIREEQ
jgi:RNAse (barnase) inhibitor barstar